MFFSNHIRNREKKTESNDPKFSISKIFKWNRLHPNDYRPVQQSMNYIIYAYIDVGHRCCGDKFEKLVTDLIV